MFEKLLLVFFIRCALFFEMVFHGKLGGLFKCEHCSSKYWFNGVAYFDNVRFRLGKRFFCWIFIFPSKVPDELNSLKEPSTFKG